MIRADSNYPKYLTQVSNGTHRLVSDTTADKGGANGGFRPHELLEAALASCMNMNLRMAAETHAIPLTGASVTVSLNRSDSTGPVLEYALEFAGDLSEEQKQVLLKAVEACPVRMTLSQPLRFQRRGDARS